jgi:hypothetical protein
MTGYANVVFDTKVFRKYMVTLVGHVCACDHAEESHVGLVVMWWLETPRAHIGGGKASIDAGWLDDS